MIRLPAWFPIARSLLLSNWHKSIATLAYTAEPTSTMTVRRHRPLMIPADARGCRFISVILGRKWKEFSQRGWVVSIYLWACENGNILYVTWKQGVLAGAGGRCRVCFPCMYLLMCYCVCVEAKPSLDVDSCEMKKTCDLYHLYKTLLTCDPLEWSDFYSWSFVMIWKSQSSFSFFLLFQ